MLRQNYNKEFKKSVLITGLCDEEAKASSRRFRGDDRAYKILEEDYGKEPVKCARAVNNSSYHRKKRVRSKVGEYVHFGHCLFLTFTFTDETLAKTSAQTRRRYVARWLKKNCLKYAANIDFGEDDRFTHREHYHAIAVCGNVDYKSWHKYGAIKGEKIRDTKKDAVKVSKYVAKLSNHALKVKGVQPRLIYHRVSFEEKVKKAKFLADAF